MTKYIDSLGLKRLVTKIGEAVSKGTWLPVKKGDGEGSVVMGRDTLATEAYSHAEGFQVTAMGKASHAEGYNTEVSGDYSQAQGSYNYDDPSFIDMVGISNSSRDRKNASVIYVGRESGTNEPDPSDPKNGYQYLLGVGGYKGQAIEEGMKSVQEVIADLEKGVSETMTIEDIREIMSA